MKVIDAQVHIWSSGTPSWDPHSNEMAVAAGAELEQVMGGGVANWIGWDFPFG